MVAVHMNFTVFLNNDEIVCMLVYEGVAEPDVHCTMLCPSTVEYHSIVGYIIVT